MRLITERTEVAKAINGHKYPVITIDLANADEYGLKSEKVLINNGTFSDGFPYFIKCEVRAYSDEKTFEFSQGGCCLKDSFNYSDMKEMLEYRNAPVVEADQDVIIAIIDSNKKEAYYPMLLHTGKRIDAYCSTPLTFEDTDYSTKPYLMKAGVREWGK